MGAALLLVEGRRVVSAGRVSVGVFPDDVVVGPAVVVSALAVVVVEEDEASPSSSTADVVKTVVSKSVVVDEEDVSGSSVVVSAVVVVDALGVVDGRTHEHLEGARWVRLRRHAIPDAIPCVPVSYRWQPFSSGAY